MSVCYSDEDTGVVVRSNETTDDFSVDQYDDDDYFHGNELDSSSNVNNSVDALQQLQSPNISHDFKHKQYLYSSTDDIDRSYPIRTSSCISCTLCHNNIDTKRNKDGGFPLRKVVSCSICTWDVEEFEFEDNLMEEDEEEEKEFNEDKISESEERISDYPAIEENSCVDDDDQDCSRKRSNSYTKAMEDDYDVTDTSKRLPPDGGEVEENIVEEKHQRIEEQRCSSPKSRTERKKNFKKKPQTSIDKKISQELDEIFGKLHPSPHQSFEYDDLDVNEKFQKTKKSVSFKKLVRTPSFLRKKRSKSKFDTLSKSKSVEQLYSSEPIVEVNLPKSVSTMDVSLYYGDDGETVSDLHINEAYIEYLNSIGGTTIFGCNDNLRFIWHQISAYQHDLMDSFDDFLTSVIDEIQQAYKKCQEFESSLSLKLQQQEKEIAKVYDDAEIAMRQDRDQLQEKRVEKEEQIKNEFVRLLKSKEQELQEVLKNNTTLELKDEKLYEENQEFKQTIDKLEAQNKIATFNENTLTERNGMLEDENLTLTEKLKLQEDTIQQLHFQLYRSTTLASESKENYERLLRRFKDLNEEKEHLEESCSNLTTDLEELKTNNNRPDLEKQYSWSTASSVDFDWTSSPNFNDENSNSYQQSITDSTSYNKATDSVIILTKQTPRVRHSSPYQTDIDERNRYIQTPSGLTALINHNTDINTHISNNLNQPPINACKSPSKVYNQIPKPFTNLTKHSTPKRRIGNFTQQNTPIKLASSKHSEFKVIFTGDPNVGKTSIIRRLCHGRFKQMREITNDIDCSTMVVDCKGKPVTLKLWDTVGTEKFNSIPPSYFRKSDVVILVYDIMDEGTFCNAKKWLRQIHDYTDENIFLILVGNKSDLHHKRMIAPKRAEHLAAENDAMFIETSAKSGENTDELCQMIASTLLDREDTVFIRNDFESSLCSLSYSMKTNSEISICCN